MRVRGMVAWREVGEEAEEEEEEEKVEAEEEKAEEETEEEREAEEEEIGGVACTVRGVMVGLSFGAGAGYPLAKGVDLRKRAEAGVVEALVGGEGPVGLSVVFGYPLAKGVDLTKRVEVGTV